MNLEILKNACLKYAFVGSRVTCDPAPTDTDQDVLVLTTRNLWADVLNPRLEVDSFVKGGSNCGDPVGYMAETPLSFQSSVKDELNLIVTMDAEFFRRFMAATNIAKRLNIMAKTDRVDLFQAVLGGNEPAPALPILPTVSDPFGPPNLPACPPPPPPLPYVSAYWVSGEKGQAAGCIEAYSDPGARSEYLLLYGAEPEKCELLPYPAQPRLKTIERPGYGTFPSFCYEPHRCKGRSSCPQRYSCTE